MNMKRNFKISFLFCGVIFCFLLIACPVFDSSSFNENWGGKTVSWDYSEGDTPVFELTSDIEYVNLSFKEPVDVFMVNMNFSDNIIYKDYNQYYIPEEDSRSVLNSTLLPINKNVVSNLSKEKNSGEILRKHVSPDRFVPDLSKISFSKKDTTPLSAVLKSTTSTLSSSVVTDYEIGDQKYIWIDLSIDENEFYEAPATLCAVGDHCYVWVVDEYYSINEKESFITKSQAEEIKETFEMLYPLVTDVFGKESNQLMHYTTSSYYERPVLLDMSEGSDTGEMINIVIYDIDSDYERNQESGVLGYFKASDYYSTVIADAYENELGENIYTNVGKYFYIDSYFATAHEKMTYSTLAHEFQHMINFGNKTIPTYETSKMVVSDVWYTEMLSMLAEDMLQVKLEIDDKNSPVSRLNAFCVGYYLSGINQWLEGNEVIYSYANTYAFGAYLARNFGGAALVKEIAQNDYVDIKSITKALQSMGYEETFESVFEKYIQAVFLDNPPSGAEVSFCKDEPLFSPVSSSYRYPMKEIDIFAIPWIIGNQEGKGPVVVYAEKENRIDLAPYSFMGFYIGSSDKAGSVDLQFSRSKNSKAKTYLLIQPSKQYK